VVRRGHTLIFLPRRHVAEPRTHSLRLNRALVSKSDRSSLEFPASCETFRRRLVYKGPEGETVDRVGRKTAPYTYVKLEERSRNSTVGYTIGSVFTAPEARGKGAARCLMRLLHHALADPAYLPVPAGLQVEGPQDAMASTLYSDIGPDFYARCKPFVDGFKGWEVDAPREVSWDVDGLENAAEEGNKAVEILEADIHNLARDDAAESLLALKGPALVFPLMGDDVVLLLARSKFYARAMYGRPEPRVFGVRLSSGSFVLWSFEYGKRVLEILRLRCRSPEELVEILAAAAREAKRQGCERIDAWNVDEELLLGRKNEERTSSLPAIAWYGPGRERPRWIQNEHYAWS
jgi:GNAT superfamily N-acetyltransferase